MEKGNPCQQFSNHSLLFKMHITLSYIKSPEFAAQLNLLLSSATPYNYYFK